jgi:AcrR family transcriptional regulator
MVRWEPNAAGRLQKAAMELFLERGYAEVTVTEIADRAGLTKRSFFNHFADKREVFFAGARDLEMSVTGYLGADTTDTADTDIDTAGADPVAAAVDALTRGGLELAPYIRYAAARRALVASSLELRERELVKLAALAAAVAGALRGRQVPARTADFAARAAVTVFTTAFDDWADDPAADFRLLMRRALAELRQSVSP